MRCSKSAFTRVFDAL